MSITFVGSNTATVTNTGLNMSLPASIQGDLVLVFIACLDEARGGPPNTAGYTTLADLLHTTDNCRFAASYKFMGAVPDGNVTTSLASGLTTSQAAMALVFRGVHSTPLDVTVTTNNAGTQTTISPPITPAHDDCSIVVAAAATNFDDTVGSVSGYLPSPAVQTTISTISCAAAYRVLTGQASVTQTPGAWSTWTNAPIVKFCSLTIALRTFPVDLVAVDKATTTLVGKTIAQVEKVAVNKATVGYLGKTINIPDSSVEAIFVDKYRMVITGKSVELLDINRAITVTPAAVLYRGRIVTPRDIQFEDVPRYQVKGRGSGHWMETR